MSRSAATKRAWTLRVLAIAFFICGCVFHWWWPVLVLTASLLLIDALRMWRTDV